MTTSRSFTRRVYYEVYVDSGTNIVEVQDLSTNTYYSASGYNYLATVNGYPNTPCSSFTVYDNGVQIDSYDGPSGA
ncbi:hypothetical protein [Mucilaginibacter sp. L3T2-6]|uniref:hypothetical protein n=1 Tax=Mucilaginibacter sp. L3T2-6 TaxID=3062491 RepID=UPI0026763370|nr:hypothetical protein [Mucilaginibacter sp. L3T2-6]